jgi:hypothetical protein
MDRKGARAQRRKDRRGHGREAFGLGLLAALGLAACPSSTTAGAGGAITTGSGGSGGGGSGGSGGTPTCGTCAYVYANGGVVCGNTPSADAWQALIACACQGTCDSACGASFCTTAPVDPGCGTCLGASCAAAQTACAMN